MNELTASVLEDIETASYAIAQEATAYYWDWRNKKIYIPTSALKAMGRRYLHLRDARELYPVEVYEFGRLYAFFSLVYPPDGDIPSPAGISIDFCNLLSRGLPISKSISSGGGE